MVQSRAWISWEPDYVWGMKALLVPLVATALLLAGCSKSNSSNPPASTNATSTSAATPGGYLGSLVNAKKSSQNKIDVVSLNQALQQYNVAEGHYPKTLQELVPSYIAKIPQPAFGYKLVYDLTNGTVKVVRQ